MKRRTHQHNRSTERTTKPFFRTASSRAVDLLTVPRTRRCRVCSAAPFAMQATDASGREHDRAGSPSPHIVAFDTLDWLFCGHPQKSRPRTLFSNTAQTRALADRDRALGPAGSPDHGRARDGEGTTLGSYGGWPSRGGRARSEILPVRCRRFDLTGPTT
jgi:hypothetical protein